MDFNLTEEQRLLQETATAFNELEIEPIAEEIDQKGRLPDNLIKKMAEIGLLGMTIEERYGGSGIGHLNCILACERIAYSGTGAWWLVAFNNSIPACIAQFGSEEIKKRYLKPLCDGTAYGSMQFTEEDTGSDPKALRTTAKQSGNSYLINGMKRFSTFAARDGYAVLYAKDETGACSAFVIEKNVEGYEVSNTWKLMGGGGIEAVDVYFENMKVSRENLLGNKGQGFEILLFWIAMEKIEQCAACLGIAQAALDEAIDYAKSRKVREKSLTDMQGIRWILADMESKIEASRWLIYKTAFMLDMEEKGWKSKAALTKLFAVPTCIEVVERARHIHGAYGYTKSYKIERLYRTIAGASAIATSLEINRSIVGSSVLRL